MVGKWQSDLGAIKFTGLSVFLFFHSDIRSPPFKTHLDSRNCSGFPCSNAPNTTRDD